ncbi:MAG: hypothetical protein A2511_17405 [Deltaproteobacteria bacterium RIFOXYD12_FULL_50_9]|nr:MAG: hypothetical protein A2511_17405 [Deltaproteobacteria bacterium RIFOXYD12_FULL_50_9]
MKMNEIKEKAKQMGIKPGKMSKADLIRSIQAQEGNDPCFQTAKENCDQVQCCCWSKECLTL